MIFFLFFREVNGTKYDLIIYEAMGSFLLGFTDLVGNPPIIGVYTSHLPAFAASTWGNPTIPSYIPSLLFPFSDHMTFRERFENLYFEIYSRYIMDWYVKPIQDKYMHKNFGNFHHTLEELESNVSLTIVSTDLSTGYPKPMQPNTVHVGPMHVRHTPDPLPEVCII